MKEKVQRFGRFLSAMVMPNIGAFIAWGIITALFIPDGYLPNETLNEMVTPMSHYLLPLLIAYTGGKVVAGDRGGVIGAIATMGVIVGAPDTPMFLGAMVMGPLAGWCIKKFDKAIDGKVKAGFEMLVNNFSVGILGAILAILGVYAITPLVNGLTGLLEAGVGFFVNHGLLPLASVFVEPAKVLFLNNAINHGIFSPMGMKEVEAAGSSIFFLLEANPGPGLGILLAYCIFGKGSAKSSAPGAAIIHFLGGIHEIYFPYILMNPLLLLSAIAGGATGIFVEQLLGAGLVAPASPGSMIAILGMTAPGKHFAVIAGVLAATVVSFLVSMPILKFAGKDTDLEAAQAKKDAMKSQSKGQNQISEKKASEEPKANGAAGLTGDVKKIAFACDAGMGSSAMGATVLKKKMAAAGIQGIEVIHTPVSSIPQDVQIVVTHESLGDRARHSNPQARVITITNFMAAPEYDVLINDLKK